MGLVVMRLLVPGTAHCLSKRLQLKILNDFNSKIKVSTMLRCINFIRLNGSSKPTTETCVYDKA